jgi:hypothetical protein
MDYNIQSAPFYSSLRALKPRLGMFKKDNAKGVKNAPSPDNKSLDKGYIARQIDQALTSLYSILNTIDNLMKK